MHFEYDFRALMQNYFSFNKKMQRKGNSKRIKNKFGRINLHSKMNFPALLQAGHAGKAASPNVARRAFFRDDQQKSLD